MLALPEDSGFLDLLGTELLTASGAVNWGQWFTHCWVAIGAANAASSYIDKVGTQTLAVVGSPTWSATNGWGPNGNGTNNYLNTAQMLNNGGTLMLQFAGITGNTIGGVGTGGQRFGFAPVSTTNRAYYYGSSGAILVAGALAAGNMCISGGVCYVDGVPDGTVTGTFTGTSPVHILNATGLTGIGAGYVRAAGLRADGLTGAQVAAAAAAMAALTG